MGEIKPEEINLAGGSEELTGSTAYLAIPDHIPSPTSSTAMKESTSDEDGMQDLVDPHERETWGKKIDFLLSVIGFAVDLANVWRFPYLCFQNGGGVFLIPYYLMYVFVGVPLFYMELALGQYNRKGAITTWGRICPLFKGIGYCVVMIAFYVDFYYNVIISWALYYLVASLNTHLPWSTCNNTWNTKKCYEIADLHVYNNNTTNADGSADWWACRPTAFNTSGDYKSSSEEYFFNSVLKFKDWDTMNELGEVRWKLVLSLMTVYLICYFSLWKGISMSGKVVWFTAVFPYIVLSILLVRGLTLPGASIGIEYYLKSDPSKLFEAKVWFDAATQVFFSLGPGFGVLLAFASYNKFDNNVYLDALLTSGINTFTSFLSGFVIFSVLGYMACKTGREVKDVAAEGPGLVFVVYPEALSTMPGATMWSIVFFLMLLTLGLDSSFGGSEAIITALSDEFPILHKHREIFVAGLFSLYMVVGFFMCTQGGVFIVEFFNIYAATFGLLIAVLCETIAVSWIYGLRRFSGDIQEMLGFQPGIYWKVCWAIIAPPFLLVTLCYGIYGQAVGETPGAYGVPYPTWANVLGWLLGFSSALAIPIVGFYKLCTTPGRSICEKFRNSLIPWKDSPEGRRYHARQQGQTEIQQEPSGPLYPTDRPPQYVVATNQEMQPMNGLKTVYL